MTPDTPTGRLPPVVTCRRAIRILPGRILPGLVLLALLPLPAAPARAEPPVDGESFALAAGESRAWTVELAAGEAFRLRALPRGVDVELRLFTPPEPRSGKGTKVSAPVRSQGVRDRYEQEELAVVAGRPGPHRIEVHAHAGRGRCRLELDGPRPATDEDRRRVEAAAATQALFDAYSAHDQADRTESAKEAAVALEQALTRTEGLLLAWRELGDPGREAALLYVRGMAAYGQAEYHQAADDLHCAARLAGVAGDEAFTADALNNVGRAERRRGWPQQAAALFLEALELYRDQGDLGLQAVALSNIGNAYKDLGDPRTAVDHLQESLRLARAAGDSKTALGSQVNLCNVLQSLHDREAALATCQAALEEARSQGNDELEGAALNNLGTLHESLGEWDQALELYKLALQQAKNLGNADWEGRTLINLGFLYQRSWREADPGQDPLKEAEASYRAALKIMQGLPDKKMKARALSQLALVEVQRGRGPEALQLAQQALSLATDPEEADPEEEPIARFALGEALRLTGNLPQARQQLVLARDIQRRRGDLNLEAGANFALARVERALDDLPAAVAQAEAALALIESLRARVVSPDLRASFLASKQDYYAFKIDTLMRLHERAPLAGYADDALQASDRARARSLFEVLSQAQALRRGVAPALLDRERRASEELNVGEWYRKYSLRNNAALAPEVSLKLASAQAESQKVEEELLLASPLYATLAQPHSTPIAEIQRDILDPDTLLVEYHLADERSYAWAVTSGGVTGIALPGRATIEDVARRLYEQLTAPRPTEAPAALDRRIAELKRTAAELSELVLAPVAALLRSKQRLVVVSDGALQYVPFEVLPLPVATSAAEGPPARARAEQLPWLIESHEVVVLPSASVIALIRRELAARRPPAGALAVLADPVFRPDDWRLHLPPVVPHAFAAPGRLSLVVEAPDVPRTAAPPAPARPATAPLPRLPFSEREAEAIAKLARGGEVLKALGFAASRETALSGRLADFRRVHFATHGVLDSQHPEQTSLVLSLFDDRGAPREGHLHLRDVYELELNADLVVLSACQTALGKELRGEGLIGLTRGFMHAGAARVVASLWSVQDRATAKLMERFYDSMLTHGLRPAAALREAQLSLARDQQWKDPYYWAAFSLQGEWR